MSSMQQLVIETWVEYSIATIFVVLRYYTRIRMVGFRRFDYDDYLMPVGWLLFTVMSVMAQIVSTHGDTANMTDEYRKNIGAAEAATRIRGSKAFMAGLFTYTAMLWTLKLCMLAFLRRVTSGLSSAKFIMPTVYAVAASWVLNIVLFSAACRPFHKLWQIYPDPGKHCTPENPAFYTVVLAVNLVTDLCIVAIPIPMLLQAKVSIKRKILLFLLLCAGVFVMIAAVLRVVFVFKNAGAVAPAIWACRETLVAMIVSNAPLIRPLFSTKWWRGEYTNSNQQQSAGYAARSGSHTGHMELESQKSTSAHIYSTSGKKDDDNSSSTEHIVPMDTYGHHPGVKVNMGISVQRDFDVTMN